MGIFAKRGDTPSEVLDQLLIGTIPIGWENDEEDPDGTPAALVWHLWHNLKVQATHVLIEQDTPVAIAGYVFFRDDESANWDLCWMPWTPDKPYLFTVEWTQDGQPYLVLDERLQKLVDEEPVSTDFFWAPDGEGLDVVLLCKPPVNEGESSAWLQTLEEALSHAPTESET